MTDDARATLRAAWEEYCDRLKAAGDLIFAAEPEGSELDLAVGVQYLTQQMAKGLKLELEFKDAEYPQIWTLQTPVSKDFGDNPDCNYLVAYIDGGETYRLWGTRGSASWVRLTTRLLDPELGMNYADGVPPGATLAQEDIAFGPDGAFEVIVGPDEHPGNWMKTAPGPQQLMFRQFFGDWAAEQPARLQIERVGAQGSAPAPLTAGRVAKGLADAAQFVHHDTRRWLDWLDFYRPQANRFVEGVPDFTGTTYKATSENRLGRMLKFCYFEIAPDEALVIEFTPPDCAMWIFEQNTRWMTSMDYRYHFSSLNSVQATAEDDGSVRIVVSSTDPGVPNWLDTAGHEKGLLIGRWVELVGAEDPVPSTRLVELAELGEVLAGAKRIDAEGRLAQRVARRRGVANRFQL